MRGMCRRVSFTDNAARREDISEVGDFICADGNVGRGEIFPNVFGAFGAWDRHDVEWLCQQPCQCQLAWATVLLGGQRLEGFYRQEIGREVGGGKAGVGDTEVSMCEGGVWRECAGERGPAQRAVGHQRDAQFTARRRDGALNAALP
jgi:hypothetical protein